MKDRDVVSLFNKDIVLDEYEIFFETSYGRAE